MSQAISLPIRFRFLRTPCVWKIRTIELEPFAVGAGRKALRMLFATIDPRRPDLLAKPQKLDGWDLREEFFTLPETETSLLGFLSKVGVWQTGRVGASLPYVFTPIPPFVYTASEEIMRYCRAGNPPPLSVDAIWDFSRLAKEHLVNRNRFIKTHARARSKALTSFETLHAIDKFDLSFELEKNPEGVVTVSEGRQMFLTTIYADIVRGLGFKYCRRNDCEALVPITNNHEKYYCSQPCAHLDNVRKKRREAREAAERRRLQTTRQGLDGGQ